MHTTPGADAFPATVALLDDSDAPTAANFNVGTENLADRTVSLSAHKLSKDAPDTITGAIDVAPPGSLTIDEGATEHLNGTLEVGGHGIVQFASGGVLQGTIAFGGGTTANQGNLDLDGASITAQSAGAVVGHAAGSITANATGAIRSNAVGGGIVLAGGNYDEVTYDPPRTRRVVRACAPNGFGGSLTTWICTTGSMAGITDSTPTRIVPTSWMMAIPAQNGATLTRVAFTYVLAGTPRAVPSGGKVGLQLWRSTVGVSGLGDVSMLSGGTDYLDDSAYGAAAGSVVMHAVNPDVYNTTIDNTSYTYTAVILNDYGTGAIGGNTFFHLHCTFENVQDMRFSG